MQTSKQTHKKIEMKTMSYPHRFKFACVMLLGWLDGLQPYGFGRFTVASFLNFIFIVEPYSLTLVNH